MAGLSQEKTFVGERFVTVDQTLVPQDLSEVAAGIIGTYVAPKIDLIVVRAEEMFATTASRLITASGAVVWSFDQAVAEAVNAVVYPFPSHWATFDVEYWWTTVSAASGNVVHRMEYGPRGDGDALGTLTGIDSAAFVAPAQNVLKVSVPFTGMAVPSNTKALTLSFGRRADSGSDTLAGDSGLLMVVLRRAT